MLNAVQSRPSHTGVIQEWEENAAMLPFLTSLYYTCSERGWKSTLCHPILGCAIQTVLRWHAQDFGWFHHSVCDIEHGFGLGFVEGDRGTTPQREGNAAGRLVKTVKVIDRGQGKLGKRAIFCIDESAHVLILPPRLLLGSVLATNYIPQSNAELL